MTKINNLDIYNFDLTGEDIATIFDALELAIDTYGNVQKMLKNVGEEGNIIKYANKASVLMNKISRQIEGKE